MLNIPILYIILIWDPPWMVWDVHTYPMPWDRSLPQRRWPTWEVVAARAMLRTNCRWHCGLLFCTNCGFLVGNVGLAEVRLYNYRYYSAWVMGHVYALGHVFFFSVQHMVLVFWKHRSHLVSHFWKATVPTKNKVVGLARFRTLFVGVGIIWSMTEV